MTVLFTFDTNSIIFHRNSLSFTATPIILIYFFPLGFSILDLNVIFVLSKLHCCKRLSSKSNYFSIVSKKYVSISITINIENITVGILATSAYGTYTTSASIAVIRTLLRD